jgi:hypothetical protein
VILYLFLEGNELVASSSTNGAFPWRAHYACPPDIRLHLVARYALGLNRIANQHPNITRCLISTCRRRVLGSQILTP